jgi:predicted permease
MFYSQLVDRLSGIPGVQAVGTVDYLPLSNTEGVTSFEMEDYQNDKLQLIENRRISPRYFEAMQIPLLNGREFSDVDGSGAEGSVIVNHAFAKRYFDNRNPIGHRLRLNPDQPWLTIIGVVSDIRSTTLEASPPEQVYTLPWMTNSDQSPMMGSYLAVRSSLPEGRVRSEIGATLHSLDPNLALAEVHTMGDRISEASARRRFQTILLTLFAGDAMLLVLMGVYGHVTYDVEQMRSEIGLRIAIGSSRIKIARLVVIKGGRLVSIGLLIGIPVAMLCTRLVSRWLYGLPAIDPITFITVPAVLLATTVIACLVPGCRAAFLDPIKALRHD